MATSSGHSGHHQAISRKLKKAGRVLLKCDGTRWRTGRKVKGKLANGVGSQYPSHYLGTWCIQHYYHYYRWCAHLGFQQSTELTPPPILNGLVRFAERRNLVSARVPSHFNWPRHIVQNRQFIWDPIYIYLQPRNVLSTVWCVEVLLWMLRVHLKLSN
jgi:hypothetical protein